LKVLYEILPDPRPLLELGPQAHTQTLQIHRPIPEIVPVGHFACDREIVDTIVRRSGYLGWVDQACAVLRNKLEVRFFDHFEDEFDAAVLDGLPSAQVLSVDGVPRVVNPEAIGKLPSLRSLRFGPVRAGRSDILQMLGIDRLTEFTLAGTAAPKIDLAPLVEARSLRTLRLLGHGKNIEAIATLTELKELAIQPSAHASIQFIGGMTSLEVLKFVLGSTTTIAPLPALPALRDLSCREVRYLEDLGDLERFANLRRLQVSDQPRLAQLRFGPKNTALEHIYLYAVPGLAVLDGLRGLPGLKSLFAYDSGLEPPWHDLPNGLTHFQFVTRTTKGRDAHDAQVRQAGLIPGVHPDAAFFYK
jgi:hypothetical protein